MSNNIKLLCNYKLIEYIDERNFNKLKSYTISLTDDNKKELKIFINNLDNKINNYEVQIYKNSPMNKFIQHIKDSIKIKTFTEYNDFYRFVLSDYSKVKDFIHLLTLYIIVLD